ncbi:MAG: PHP domain-containing protein, partial [Gammaproteobacteria bacterium]|nr:PHP domain-containing protein [Gammaproteobacteria bacterium]
MFVPLRNYTQFTIHESILRLDRWLNWLKENQINAAAITDKNNCFGLVQFYQAALSKKIKPIIGAHVQCNLNARPNSSADLLIYAKNYRGYQNLSNWISKWYAQERPNGLDLKFCLENAHDLMLICPPESIDMLIQSGVDLWKGAFEDRLLFGIERYPNDAVVYQKSIECLQKAASVQVPAIVCNRAFFESPEDFNIQQIKNCIQEGYYLQDESRAVNHKPSYCLYPPHVIQELFSDCPDVIENTHRFAQKCTVELTLGKAMLPQFAKDENMTLRQQSIA